MKRYLLPTTLGLAHGAADGASGLMLGSLPHTMPLLQVGLLVLFYNALAFGSQPVVGFLADQLKRPRMVALLGLGLHIVALLVLPYQPSAAVILIGLGSAGFHVGAGALALEATHGRASGPGLFAAPGVVGLGIGGALAISGHVIVWPFVVLLLAIGVVIALLEQPTLPYNTPTEPEPILEGHDIVMAVLLMAIALRSAVWTTMQFLLQGQVMVLVLVAVAAGFGKVLGGLLADRIGWRRWAVGVLLIAAPILTFGQQQLIPLLVGVALLQSATPVALAATAQLFPRQPAAAAGLALGLAIAVGGLPMVFGLGPVMGVPPILLVLTLIAALLMWSALSLQKRIRLPSIPQPLQQLE